jgi:hypothetical protein
MCVGCGRTYPADTPSKFVKLDTIGSGHFLVFHSVDCLISWERRERD